MMSISGASGNLQTSSFSVLLWSDFSETKNNKYKFVVVVTSITGRHSRLWCTILVLQMHLARDERRAVQERTLEHLKKTLQKFQTEGNGDIKKAKDYFNVIHEPLFDIPLDQVIYIMYPKSKIKNQFLILIS